MILLVIVTFFCLAISTLPIHAQIATPRLTPDRLVYPIWKIGGTISITASNLVPNASYYLWLQRPTDPLSHVIGIAFLGTSGTITLSINVTKDDPSGTYLVSLSTSNSQDNRQAVAHFGVFGTDASRYRRTQQVVIAGGGLSPNSTVSINATVAGRAVAGSPFSARCNAKGEFTYPFKTNPSFTLGVLVFTAIGSSFDGSQTTSTSISVTLTANSINVQQFAQPPTPTQRTAVVSMSYQLKYVDGSPVTNSTVNSTRVRVVTDIDRSIIANVSMALSNRTNGVWTATWVPPASANLTLYHFEMSPSDFDDSYGNFGNGTTINSQDFQVIPASTTLQFQANATLQRRQVTPVFILAKYHNGSNFANVTQTLGSLTGPGGAPQTIILNKTLTGFTTYLEVRENATLGVWTVSANVRDIYSNVASGTFTIQVVKANLGFDVVYSTAPERTAILNVTAKVTYPDGSKVAANTLPKGLNVTITIGNFTWNHPMNYDQTAGVWFDGYRIPQNATLGDYAISMKVDDAYGNGGQFAAISKIIPARFRFIVPKPTEKTDPLTLVNIGVFVMYPDGSALTPWVGGHVTASLTNSSGTFALPMEFNTTDRSWHLLYKSPNLGLSFGVTLTFTFDAHDQYGNAGSDPSAYNLAVAAAVGALILSATIGAIGPIVISAWAILTIPGRRRKHKP